MASLSQANDPWTIPTSISSSKPRFLSSMKRKEAKKGQSCLRNYDDKPILEYNCHKIDSRFKRSQKTCFWNKNLDSNFSTKQLKAPNSGFAKEIIPYQKQELFFEEAPELRELETNNYSATSRIYCFRNPQKGSDSYFNQPISNFSPKQEVKLRNESFERDFSTDFSPTNQVSGSHKYHPFNSDGLESTFWKGGLETGSLNRREYHPSEIKMNLGRSRNYPLAKSLLANDKSKIFETVRLNNLSCCHNNPQKELLGMIFRSQFLCSFSIKNISSLFSSFGNISWVVRPWSSGEILVCYDDSRGFQNCLEAFKLLEVDTIDFELIPFDNYFAEYFLSSLNDLAFFKPRKRFSRMNQGLPKIFNPISRTLHASLKLTGNSFGNEISKETLFAEFPELKKALRVYREPCKNPKKINQWFIEFPTTKTSLITLMRGHEKSSPSKGFLRLSFTKDI